MENNRNQLTVRLDPQVMTKFEDARKTYRSGEVRTAAAAAAEAIRFWSEHVLKNDGTVMESLISSVIQQLQADTSWALAALAKVDFSHWDTLFSQRVQHFFSEKKSINKFFIPFLVARMLHQAKGKQVRLIVDSGSTLKSTFDELVPELYKVRLELMKLPEGQIQIITNNYPGAASYESSANRPEHRVGLDKRISDLVPCHLVPGRAIQDYAAIMGEEATAYVRNATRQKNDTCIIGLVVGNWMLLHGNRPVALARGEGHPQFKKAVLEAANEIFLITPLCKLFLGEKDTLTEIIVKDIDDSLRKLDRKGSDRPYEGVQIPEGIARVVTTMRPVRQDRQSIVVLHSQLVNQRLGKPPDSFDRFIEAPIQEIPHLIYPHDEASTKSFDEQLKIEFPHTETQDERFRELYFHCSARPPKAKHEGAGS